MFISTHLGSADVQRKKKQDVANQDRLSCELPGFNWLEEKIRLRSLEGDNETSQHNSHKISTLSSKASRSAPNSAPVKTTNKPVPDLIPHVPNVISTLPDSAMGTTPADNAVAAADGEAHASVSTNSMPNQRTPADGVTLLELLNVRPAGDAPSADMGSAVRSTYQVNKQHSDQNNTAQQRFLANRMHESAQLQINRNHRNSTVQR